MSCYSLDELMDLITICTKTTLFKFRDQKYQQGNGLPMGSPLSPVIAEFCMQALEEQVVQNHQYIKFWIRYVDDVYAIIKSGKVQEILNDLNSFHPSIQFTVELEDTHDIMGSKRLIFFGYISIQERR